MATEIRVPTLGESVSEATVAKWFKKPGEAVKQDEPLVELETDKVTLEVNAPASGTLAEIIADSGTTVGVAALLGQITEGGAAAAAPAKAEAPKAAAPAPGSGRCCSGQGGVRRQWPGSRPHRRRDRRQSGCRRRHRQGWPRDQGRHARRRRHRRRCPGAGSGRRPPPRPPSRRMRFARSA